ncbi:1-(5-phosphoribosyl)-5-[(5-phosphoribosylamino) methylideneamino] imidazole-4-carboxamide isomerase [bacterium HR29]|nr:1-(5-phosphoribosyl)-5-[(5-phosphoribosylamino) methylideneamino] imidazole-4-carboxamide isomerase [bacterium HR29]
MRRSRSGRGALTFEVIPAVDIREGRAVRLLRGDYAAETVYGDDPVAVAVRWASLGAPRLHVVDLDGARAGRPVNLELIGRICRSVAVPVEVSGGLRSLDAVAAAFDAGADRVQLGSAAVRSPEFAGEAARRWPGRVVVALDTRGGRIAVDGWQAEADGSLIELAERLAALGVPRLMVTDIERDGALAGPNLELYRQLVRQLPVPVVASGGVRTVADLLALAEVGCEGAVVGKALYEGVLDLRDALEAVARC